MKGEAEGQAPTRIADDDRPLLSMTARVIGVPPPMLCALYGRKSQREQTNRSFWLNARHVGQSLRAIPTTPDTAGRTIARNYAGTGPSGTPRMVDSRCKPRCVSSLERDARILAACPGHRPTKGERERVISLDLFIDWRACAEPPTLDG